ncbi:alpha/beta hydrolase [Bradyrhizobium liaoningense]|uniref:alpha/beta hydrolase n=1 Tax=Bradyrhizobium liaoningense TaxID=43992 RepID=UPI001BAA28EF|nr:alpha/beta fold hydrolase [Bradyrhizobium liaoningense]MBR0706268.1 alpha/beta fold hydrolase [Bradyrhizobium liaoningense]
MPTRDLSVVKTALIDFFKARLTNKATKISTRTDVRAACGLKSDSKWRALAKAINSLPSIVAAKLRISEGDLLEAKSVGEILKRLRAASLVSARSGKLTVAKPISTSPIVVKTDNEGAQYAVWYGTNRKPIDAKAPNRGYSNERDDTTHYGKCIVSVPKSHKIGSIGSSWWKRLLSRTDDRLKITDVSELNEDAFWASAREHLAKVAPGRRDVVIFVHGYNVSFSAAALRAAQVGFDLSIEGVMAFFSWPSQGILKGYISDEATIEASEVSLADFIEKFASEGRRVHLIAHSMGNRGVLRAVNRIEGTAKRRKALFGQIILAAADVDAGTFKNLCDSYVRSSSRATLYVSPKDRAVEASRWLHDFPRAGLLPPVMIVPGIDTINVVNSDISMLGHGYVAESRNVLQDMHALITAGTPPEKRFALQRTKTSDNEPYWIIGK